MDPRPAGHALHAALTTGSDDLGGRPEEVDGATHVEIYLTTDACPKKSEITERVTAAAPISPVHLLIGLEGGGLLRFNVNTQETVLVLDVDAGITSLSHDKFTGLVYAGLSTLEIVELDPFSGEASTFAMMPGKGRGAVSPSGRLWFMPVKYIQAGELSAWELPDMI